MKMKLDKFAHLCNQLVERMGFKVRKSVYREETVVLDAYMHIPGNSLHYVIIFLRKNRLSREDILELIDMDTVDLRWMIITTGEIDEDVKALKNDILTLMDWRDFERLITNLGLKREVLPEVGGEGNYLPSLGEFESLLQWARDFLESEDYTRALEYINRALRIKETSEALKIKARILYHMGRSDESLSIFASLLKENPEDDESWFFLGSILESMNQLEDAEEAYSQCVKYNPHNLNCWLNRGTMMLMLEKYHEALLCYEKVLSMRENMPSVWNNRGVALKYLGKYDESLKSYNMAIKFDPKFADAYLNKAILYFEKRDYEKAQNEVTQYLKLHESAEGYILLANIYLRRKREKDAIDALQRAINIEPSNTDARKMLQDLKGRVSLSENRYLEEEIHNLVKLTDYRGKIPAGEEEMKELRGKLWKKLIEKMESLSRERDLLREAIIQDLQDFAKREELKLPRNIKWMSAEKILQFKKEMQKKEEKKD